MGEDTARSTDGRRAAARFDRFDAPALRAVVQLCRGVSVGGILHASTYGLLARSTQTSPRRAAVRFFCDAPPHECVQNVSAYAPEARATSTSSLPL